MPYITKHERDMMGDGGPGPATPGQLNYAITCLIREYLSDEVSYRKLNEVVGVLECAKLELYRRVAAPYEDQKLEENGDVY